MNMKFSQLALFCALVEYGNLHAAAEKMHCVPSNISARVKALELQLGIALFQHQQRKLKITPEGRVFYQHAKILLNYAQQCQQLFESKNMLGVLNMGVASHVMRPFKDSLDGLDSAMTRQMLQFLKRYPAVQLNLSRGDGSNLITQLLQGDLDLVLSTGIPQHSQLKSKLLYAEPTYLISHHACLEDVRQHAPVEVFFHFEADAINPFDCLPVGHRHCQIADYALIFSAIKQHMGYSVIPSSLFAQAQQQQLYSFALQAPQYDQKYRIYLHWHSQPPCTLLQHFINALTQHPPIQADVVSR